MKPILMIDFGSTNTKVTAVDLDEQKVLGTAASYTTVQTDVNEGLNNALALLSEKIGDLEYEHHYACSSAAGGLKMISCGLVPELTAEAARQASLGAGAKVMKVYSYQMTEDDAEEIQQLKPDIFLLTGGTDGGNKENIIENAKILASIPLDFPIIVAGNRTAARTCEKILTEAGKDVKVCANVMPKFNELNIGPAQELIREVFLDRIIKAKGLSKISHLISGIMMPTPAAVLAAMELLSKGTENQSGWGELVAVDVGGATTDIYSMTEGLPERTNTVMKGLPEPYAKRTVEGDIGMRYSANGIVEAGGLANVCRLSGLSEDRVCELMELITTHTDTMPTTEELRNLDFALASLAIKTGVTRHAGTLEKVYTPLGEAYAQTGKDLSRVDKVVITGGSLIHVDTVDKIAAHALYDMKEPGSLKPQRFEVLVDKQYILSAMGLLSQYEPDIALNIMKKELKSYGIA
ncbi:MAG: glutamate mutase L, partial [Firmicutes bacterium]|nr:glutamate mutase L [Bacillota bacterium]